MDHKKICLNQVEEMKRHRWIESQKAGHDVGEDAFADWVRNYASDYRSEYEETYEEMIERVTEEVRCEVQRSLPFADESIVRFLTKLIVDKFTELWTVEIAKDNHNKHIEEI